MLLLLSCASGIRSMYEAERDAALGRADSPGASWSPDIRVRLSSEALDRMVQDVVAQSVLSWKETLRLDGPLGIKAQVEPSGRVTSLTLSPSTACDGCLSAAIGIAGKADWSAAGAKGSVPIEASLGATVSFELSRSGEAWATSGRITSVDKVQVSSARLGSLDASDLLGGWLSEAVKEAGPVALGQLGGVDLPVRAARLATPKGQLELQLLSDVPDGSPVNSGLSLSRDFEVRVSAPTLLALARRQAFETGAIAYDVAAIPTSLSVNDQRFTMGLRLWKLKGVGWWRDYSVDGQFSVNGGELALAAQQATEGEKSKGAGLADPIALLAEGRILEAITDGLKAAVPASSALTVGNQQLRARVREVQGDRGALVLSGELEPVQAQDGGRRMTR